MHELTKDLLKKRGQVQEARRLLREAEDDLRMAINPDSLVFLYQEYGPGILQINWRMLESVEHGLHRGRRRVRDPFDPERLR